ncbi:hypothetical protein [Evansella cellulosilytica]|uniref:Uncharacterized protein n=1 Tax=Evansella cellulosilytica (strain ATCC 21833 / DSM 2522 / FERM P-1141 / JCM 9156 / N-4) TaxID=649639 RepID=E6U191_EVAC2|nr:hypothetical protein [Evansella cellulosilytica]ADU31537.1 hypothetical protein Bcell_3295 [Evansella cellulosilytica DSM 2522]
MIKISEEVISELKYLLDKQFSGKMEEGDFDQISSKIKIIKEVNINENFVGTIQELNHYVDNFTESENVQDYVSVNYPNIKRWIDELTLLEQGGGAVTTDYEQRKGREI